MNRINNFTMIHIVAALLVIVGHEYVLLGMAPPTIFDNQVHGLGVKILFLVSGYLVSISYTRADNRRSYLCKRISRLYPPLIVCLVVTVLAFRFITCIPEYYWQSAVNYVLNNLEMRPKFDLAGVFSDNIYPVGVNGSLWTLPIEIACYFVLIPIVDIFKTIEKKNKRVAYLLLSIILLGLSVFDLYKQLNMESVMLIFWDTDWFRAVSLAIWFILGIAFNLMDLKQYCNWQVIFVISIVYMCLGESVKYVLAPYIIGYAVMCLAMAEKPLFANIFKRDICYGLYLYAFPDQQLLIYIFKIKYNIILIYLHMCFLVFRYCLYGYWQKFLLDL